MDQTAGVDRSTNLTASKDPRTSHNPKHRLPVPCARVVDVEADHYVLGIEIHVRPTDDLAGFGTRDRLELNVEAVRSE